MKRNAVMVGQLAGVALVLVGLAIVLPVGWAVLAIGLTVFVAAVAAEFFDVAWIPADAKPSPFTPVKPRLAPALSPLSGLNDALDGME